jgi:hypothetical protein
MLQDQKATADKKIRLPEGNDRLLKQTLGLREDFPGHPLDSFRREIARRINSLSLEIMTE